MSNLARILQRHDGTDYFSAKVLQAAGRFASRTSAYAMIQDGSDHYEKLREMLRRLPEPVSRDILSDLCAELPVSILPRAQQPNSEAPLRLAVNATESCATLTGRLLEALADNVLTQAEDDELERMLGELQIKIERLRAAKNSRRPRRTA